MTDDLFQSFEVQPDPSQAKIAAALNVFAVVWLMTWIICIIPASVLLWKAAF